MKQRPASSRQRCDPAGSEAELDAESGQHVGRAGARRGRAVAVLGDLHAAAATMIAASVEML